MVGGDESAYKHVEPALTTLAPKDGLGYFGKAGAGPLHARWSTTGSSTR